MKNILLIFIICLFLFSSCMFYHSITEGTITDKRIISEHYEEYKQYVEIDGIKVLITTPVYIPELYKITITNQGEILKIYIKKDVYDSLSIGDWYII